MEEPPDLESFRQEWLNELASRRQQPATEPSSSSTRSSATQSSKEPIRRHLLQEEQAEDVIDENNALELYEDAVKHESRGQMNKAVVQYRKAFKLNGDIDKIYHRESLKKASDPDQSKKAEDLGFQFQRTLHIGEDYKAPKNATASHPSSTQKLLDSLLSSFAASPWVPPGQDTPFLKNNELAFIPQTDLRPFIINSLPDELLVSILLHLLLPNKENGYPRIDRVEKFALVSRRARILALSTPIWRKACSLLYTTPYQLSPPKDNEAVVNAQSVCLSKHAGDWRRMWIEQARVRTDGAFISVCQYLRRGEAADNAWVAPSHIVVYFRFLRFLPNGTVISLTTVVPPQEIARSIDLSLRMKGMSVGRWRLQDDRIHCWGLEDQMIDRPKYSIEMEYKLKSTGRGRWNKLELLSLCTANHETNELVPVELQHNKNFFFSAVRNYEA